MVNIVNIEKSEVQNLKAKRIMEPIYVAYDGRSLKNGYTALDSVLDLEKAYRQTLNDLLEMLTKLSK